MSIYIGNKKVNINSKIKLLDDIGIKRELKNGVFQQPSSDFVFTLPSNATDIGSDALNYAFYACRYLTDVSLPNITTISGSYAMYFAFVGCSALTNVDLSNLESVNGTYALSKTFYNCSGLTTISFPSLTTINNASYAFDYAFQTNNYLTTANFQNLTNIIKSNYAFDYAFTGCQRLTTVDFSSLLSVSDGLVFNYAFDSCTALTNVDFSSLTSITGYSPFSYTFNNCTSLSSINFSNLTIIGESENPYNNSIGKQFYGCFYNCNNLKTLTFPKLEKIYCTGPSSYGTFANNNKIEKMYFPKLDTITYGTGSSTTQDACRYVFANCNSLTELHFSATNQAAIEASPGYSTAWGRGAGNVTIYFDLVPSSTVNITKGGTTDGTITVNGDTISAPYSFSAENNQSYVISGTNQLGRKGVTIKLNGTIVSQDNGTATYTLITSSDCTVQVDFEDGKV